MEATLITSSEQDVMECLLGRSSSFELDAVTIDDTSMPSTSEGGAPKDGSDIPKLLSKHKIFLSHSGKQKSFVEHLCVALERVGHSPFFDRRHESLPVGKKFPELILNAAQHCHVAVVVLSDDYLMSKWPMLELVTFVEAQRSSNPDLKILPLFFKLKVTDLEKRRKNNQLMKKWQEFATQDVRIDLKKWNNALRDLSRIVGEKFEDGESKVDYIKASVASICKYSRPNLEFNVAAMEGRERMCDIIVENMKIQQTKHVGVQPVMLGLYGMGGMGKTLICKALCNRFYSEYAGRVCHVEFQNDKDFIQVFQKILKDLTDVNQGHLYRATDLLQVDQLLRFWLPKQSVFLAVDNVPDLQMNGVREMLESIVGHLNPESKVIFTSRSLDNVQELLGIQTTCMRVPSLQMVEALNIFSRNAIPNQLLSSYTSDELEILEMCIEQCSFSDIHPNKNVSNISSNQAISNFSETKVYYHPLASKALASYLREIHPFMPSQWVQGFEILGKSQTFYKGSIFDILRSGYDKLENLDDKLLFLDIALFAPRQKLNNVKKLCDWLESVHNLSKNAIMYKLNILRRKLILEHWENEETSPVIVHDLYVEFAEHEIQSQNEKWCGYQRGGETLPKCLENSPPGLHWPNLVRIGLLAKKPLDFDGHKLQEWANVEVLCIHFLGLEHLDITPLKCLRSLDLQSHSLKKLSCSSNLNQLRFVQLDCSSLKEGPNFKDCFNLQELRVTHTYNFKLDFLPCSKGVMKVLKLSCWHYQLPDILDLQNLYSLQEVMISGNYSKKYKSDDACYQWKFSILGLMYLTNMRSLVLNMLPISSYSLQGLQNLNSLEHLSLNGCSEIISLPNLSALINLKLLDVSGTAIEELHGVDKALQLCSLYCIGCQNLRIIPNLQSLPFLREVFIQKCKSLSKKPLVSKACTLVMAFENKELSQVEDFLYAFGDLFNSGSSFQTALKACPTPTSFESMHADLYPTSQTFSKASASMHKMSTTKSVCTASTSSETILKAYTSPTSMISKACTTPIPMSYKKEPPIPCETRQAFKEACTMMHKMDALKGNHQSSDEERRERSHQAMSRLVGSVAKNCSTNSDYKTIWNSSALPIVEERSHHNTLNTPRCFVGLL